MIGLRVYDSARTCTSDSSATVRPGGDEASVHRDVAIGDHRPRELALDQCATRCTHGFQALVISERSFQRCREDLRIVGFHEPSVDASPHLIRQPAGVRRDDGPPVRHGLERDSELPS